jgi:ABC-type glycerol-3-phosphate transport system substrate-binding protein
MKRIFLFILSFSLFLSGCAGLPNLSPTATLENAPGSTLVAAIPPADNVGPTANAPLTLVVWTPPQFAPGPDSEAGVLFQARLDEFAVRHPAVRVVVRIKAEEGSGGLFDSLIHAEGAAPLALPDLIALPDELMRQAAIRGVIQPFDPYLSDASEDDWFPFAKQMQLANDNIYGLPFAADALVMGYLNSRIESPPTNWQEAMASNLVFGFPAANPQANFSLAMLQSMQGSFENSDGQTQIDEQALRNLMDYYQSGTNSGLLPFWLTQFDADSLAFEALEDLRMQMVSTWYTRIQSSELETISVAPLPTADGQPFTYAQGYVWALSSADAQRHTLAVELAEWLTAGEFLSSWLDSLDYMPTRPSGLNDWNSGADQETAQVILDSAVLLPDQLTRTTLGAPLHDAVIAVLKQEISAEMATDQVLDALNP